MILVTGFAPFGGDTINPSFEAAKALKELPDLADKVEVIELPVVFGKAGEILLDKIRRVQPEAVVCVGLAGIRKAITPEVIAINLQNARIPDNEGGQPLWEKIVPEGADGIFTRLPVQKMVEAIAAAGIPASVSYTAGAYVCNDVFYRVLHDFDGPAGFIHVPNSVELGGEMTIAQMTEGLGICIRTLIDNLKETCD